MLKHIHHIIPRHMGGTDDPLNLIELTVEEHAQAHLKLYEQFGKKEDLCAHYMLSGKAQDPEFKKLYASIGGKALAKKRKELGIKWGFALMNPDELFEMQSINGKKQGKRNADSGHMKRIQKLSDPVAAGKKGGARTIELAKGSFGNPEERLKSASKGGKTQGKRNAESGHLKLIANLPNKRTKGKIWVTDGLLNMMIDPTQEIPEGYKKGKTQKKINVQS